MRSGGLEEVSWIQRTSIKNNLVVYLGAGFIVKMYDHTQQVNRTRHLIGTLSLFCSLSFTEIT